MKRTISIKNSNNSVLVPVLLGVGGSLAVQILGAVAVANTILNGALNETGTGAAALLIRVIAVVTGALLTWYTAKDSRGVCMIVSCATTVVIWFVASLSFWDIDIGVFLIATAISVVIYGVSALFLPMMRRKQKWGHANKHYR